MPFAPLMVSMYVATRLAHGDALAFGSTGSEVIRLALCQVFWTLPFASQSCRIRIVFFNHSDARPLALGLGAIFLGSLKAYSAWILWKDNICIGYFIFISV